MVNAQVTFAGQEVALYPNVAASARVCFVGQEVIVPALPASTAQVTFVAQEVGVQTIPLSFVKVAFAGQEALLSFSSGPTIVTVANLSPIPKLRFEDNNSQALSGGKLFTYTAGTTTKLATYTDATMATPNTNPIILDTRGECSVWLPPGVSYKMVLAPATDTDPPTNPFWSQDNITSGLAQIPYGADTGAVNALSVSNVGGITNNNAGGCITVLVKYTNTGTATLNVNGNGTLTILDQYGNQLTAGALTAGQPAIFVSDGNNWRYSYWNRTQSVPFGVDTGSANAYVVSSIAGITALSAGLTVNVRIANKNTSTSTLNIAGTGAVTILDQFGNALQSGALQAGQVAQFIYDGTNWRYYYIQVQTLIQNIVNSVTGLLPSAMGAGSMTITKGQCSDSTGASYIALSSGQVWSVANGNAINGYQGGASLPTSSTIHFYICSGGTGTGTFASTSLTPTLPTGYNTYYRRIFSLKTDGSGNLIGGTALEVEGGGMLYWLTTQTLDVLLGSGHPATGSRDLVTLNVPGGIKVHPIIRTNSNGAVLFTSGDETDVGPVGFGNSTFYGSFDSPPGFDLNAGNPVVVATPPTFLTTNTSGQVGARSGPGSNNGYEICTRGWVDWRRS